MKPFVHFLLLLLLLFPMVAFAQSATFFTPEEEVFVTDEKRVDLPLSRYPTYQEYLAVMEQMATRFPAKCQLEEWGTLPSGKKILTLRLSSSPTPNASRPQVLCTAAMHGDETAGYWLLLRLAKELLEADDNRLLDELDIYINPLANPDGAYRLSDDNLHGATRGNRNNVDLNRNYPDPDDGPHPDRRSYQPETEIFMRAARERSFDLALNLHGGAEVFNYPWDTYRDRHPDTDWWRRVSREFAQKAQRASGRPSFFNDRQNGTTNGHDWYPIAGSRQDYMNYYHRCREATIEVSNAKRYPASKLPELWRSLSTALIGYISEARFGLHGSVTDLNTGNPLAAQIQIPDLDRLNSEVFSDATFGRFYRYLAEGTYQVLITAPNYVPQWREVSVKDGQKTEISVQLEPLTAKR